MSKVKFSKSRKSAHLSPPPFFKGEGQGGGGQIPVDNLSSPHLASPLSRGEGSRWRGARKIKNPLIAKRKAAPLLARRKRRENRFRFYGILAIAFAFGFLGILLCNIISSGYSAFAETRIRLPITFSAGMTEDYFGAVRESLKNHFPEVHGKPELFRLYALISRDAEMQLKDMLAANPGLLGKTEEVWLKASSDADMYFKGRITKNTAEAYRKLSDHQLDWLEFLASEKRMKKTFNSTFFSAGDSREPERAGILSSMAGSLLTILCCMLTAFPLGVMTAVYLEEFAAKNWITAILEVNINNLAAVPSIIFGLLGLAVYIGFFGLPRSSSLVGGLTLALLILPIIVIATRNSLRSIPPSIKDAAIALGASKMQSVLHHSIPLAMPGIITGTILGIARAMGETAPLLMIGMVAFIADVPRNILSPATALPVQIFLWSDSPEAGFAERTSAAIMMLILFLAIINGAAIFLRKKFEVKWS